MKKKLFMPGPVSVSDDVLREMARPMISHRGKEASLLQESISQKLKSLFFTNEEILLSTSSGTALMEAALRSCTSKKAAIFSIGAFGKRWFEIAQSNGLDADLFEVEIGNPTDLENFEEILSSNKYDLITLTHNETSCGVKNRIEELSKVYSKFSNIIVCLDTVSSAAGSFIPVDAWNIDICITSTQKALALPPGLSICTFSQKAYERAKNVKNRGYYLDLLNLYKFVKEKNYQYPSTPSLSHMFALDYKLSQIEKEGLENRFNRHKEMAKIVQNFAIQYFDLIAKDGFRSDTVTCIKNTRNIDVPDLMNKLEEKGFVISNGYGSLKNKSFRIGHMGDTTVSEIKELLELIKNILNLK